MDNSNIGLGVAPQQPLQPTIQPVQIQTPANDNPLEPNPKKKNGILIILLIIAAIAVVAIVVVLVVIQPSQPSTPGNPSQPVIQPDQSTTPEEIQHVSEDDVINYCEQHNLAVMNYDATVYCEDETATTQIIFTSYANFGFTPEDIASVGAAILENTDEYKKYFVRAETTGSDEYHYIICDTDNCISITAHDEEPARKIAIEIGYPDRNWVSDEGQQTAVNTSLKETQQSTIRRNDISRLSTSLIQYQADNSGDLPPVSDTWVGVETFDCTDSATTSACQFIQRYMNPTTGSNVNTFMDPDGTFYNLNIQSASAWSDAEKRDIVSAGGMDHTIYVVTSAVCSDEQAQKSTAKHFAIFYRMEDSNVYCVDN